MVTAVPPPTLIVSNPAVRTARRGDEDSTRRPYPCKKGTPMTLPNWLRQLRNRFTGKQSRRPIRRASRLAVEPLEARDVPATISVSNASISEAEDLSVFVPANQAVLTNSADLGFGPDRSGELDALGPVLSR